METIVNLYFIGVNKNSFVSSASPNQIFRLRQCYHTTIPNRAHADLLPGQRIIVRCYYHQHATHRVPSLKRNDGLAGSESSSDDGRHLHARTNAHDQSVPRSFPCENEAAHRDDVASFAMPPASRGVSS